MGNLTGQLYHSLLERRKAVEFEKSLLFEMQKQRDLMQRHRDDLAYRYAALAASRDGGGRRSGGGEGGGRGEPRQQERLRPEYIPSSPASEPRTRTVEQTSHGERVTYSGGGQGTVSYTGPAASSSGGD
jgi:hypothetical protein